MGLSPIRKVILSTDRACRGGSLEEKPRPWARLQAKMVAALPRWGQAKHSASKVPVASPVTFPKIWLESAEKPMSRILETLELRPFALGDAETVAPWLSGPGLSLPPGSARWPERLVEDQRIVALVACAGAERLGLLRLDCGPDGVADVTLVVDPAHRRAGVGRKVFRQALLHAREVGMRRLVAYIDLHNDPACAFFESVGFADRGVSGGRIRMERVVHSEGGSA